MSAHRNIRAVGAPGENTDGTGADNGAGGADAALVTAGTAPRRGRRLRPGVNP
ncbi:hypothetical protein ACTWPT_32185 [Nonomuraea sp. 3N208]|uniref:hypothetical protein n=1 Tax=Nonomuraea sp. 3N208 TaxID=3457421 RepID=UPI003FD2A0A0